MTRFGDVDGDLPDVDDGIPGPDDGMRESSASRIGRFTDLWNENATLYGKHDPSAAC